MKVRDILIKDLKLIFSDKKALAILILMPLVLSTILGGALKSSFQESYSTNKINIAVVKKYDVKEQQNKVLDNKLLNEFSSIDDIGNIITKINIDKIFIEDFLQNEELKKVINYTITDEETAIELLNEKKVSALVVLPENFLYNMYLNFIMIGVANEVDIKVIGHPDRNINTKIVEEIVKTFTEMTNSTIVSKNIFIESVLENNINFNELSDIENIMNKIQTNDTTNVNITFENVNGKDTVSSTLYYAIAMTTMFILFVAGYGSKLLLDEKLDKTYQRMVVSGLKKTKLISGKFFVMFLFGIVQVSIMIMYSILVLKVSWGNPINVLIITIFSIFAVAGLGIMLAAISYKSENYKVADLTQSLIFQVMALLGGSFIPIEILPDFVKTLSNFTLNGLSLKAYTKIATGYGFRDIISFLIALLLMGIVFITIGLYILNKEERGQLNDKYNKVKTYES